MRFRLATASALEWLAPARVGHRQEYGCKLHDHDHDIDNALCSYFAYKTSAYWKAKQQIKCDAQAPTCFSVASLAALATAAAARASLSA